MTEHDKPESGHRVGVFRTRPEAEEAYRQLLSAGFDRGDLSLFVGGGGSKHEKEASRDDDIEVGGEAGASLGAAAGGIGGVLSGLGLIAVPGIGPLLALGPLAAALTGAITGGALGGVGGAFVGLGLSKTQASIFEDHLKTGRALVIVNCSGRCDEAVTVMRTAGMLNEDDESA